MIGAIEILLILVIFGIIYGKDAIDKTYRKRPDENLAESFAVDIKEYYDKDPKRFFLFVILMAAGGVCVLVFMYLGITNKKLRRMMGFD